MKGIQAQAFLTFPSSFTFWDCSNQREEWRLQAPFSGPRFNVTAAFCQNQALHLVLGQEFLCVSLVTLPSLLCGYFNMHLFSHSRP